MLGTGDCFHPAWQQEIDKMEVEEGSGFLYFWGKEVQFTLTVEVSCEYTGRRVHVLLVFKDKKTVRKVKKMLEKYSPEIDNDGRPVVLLAVDKMLELIKGATDDVLFIPAHCMTPWFGILGFKNHLLDITDAFEYMPDAFETGLSADKKMIKSLQNMDKVPLVSFSDAHSVQNVGREVTVFDCEFTWDAMAKVIRGGEIDTIEFPPALGKYHITGHRKCGVKVYEYGDCWAEITCPVCRRKLTVGVEQRVQMLKCRDVELEEQYIIPLILLINQHLGIEQISRDTFELYRALVGKYKEIDMLCSVPLDEMNMDRDIKLMIEAVRNRHIKIIPGYDGVYGIIVNSYKVMNELMLLAEKLKREGGDYESVWGRVVMMEDIMVKRDMVMTPGDEQVFYGRPIPAVCDGHD